MPLKRTSDEKLEGKLFGMRGYPVRSGGPGTVNPKSITQLLVFLTKPQTNHTFEIYDIRAEGTYTTPTAWARTPSHSSRSSTALGNTGTRVGPGKVSQPDATWSPGVRTEERD